MLRVVNVAVVGLLTSRVAHCMSGAVVAKSGEQQMQGLTKVQTLQVATDECVEAHTALVGMDTCLAIAATVQEAATLTDVVALGDELCAACDVNAFEPIVATFREVCHGQPPPAFESYVEQYESASAVLLMCGSESAECYRQAFWIDENGNEDPDAPSPCELPCARDFNARTNFDSDQCGGSFYDLQCSQTLEDTTEIVTCSLEIVNIAFDPSLAEVASYCQAATCPDRAAVTERRLRETGCSAYSGSNECTDARATCISDDSGNVCWSQELEALGVGAFNSAPLANEVTTLCEIDLVAGNSTCSDACREFVDEHANTLGCCFSSLLNTCPDVDSGETLTMIQVLEQSCSITVPDLCAPRSTSTASALRSPLALMTTLFVFAMTAKLM